MTVKVLYLASNPVGTVHLELAQEARTIKDRILAASHRDVIEFVTEWAIRISDLQQYLIKHRPDVVHFSGHSNPAGKILLEDHTGKVRSVPVDGMVALFRAHKGVKAVVYNACCTAGLAQKTSAQVGCAVGMKGEIPDEAAVQFAAGLYRGIGFGFSMNEAIEQARTELALHDEKEEGWDKLPVLYPRQVELTLMEPGKTTVPSETPPSGSSTPAPVKLGEQLPAWALDGLGRADFVLVTALREERDAVLRLLPSAALLPPVQADVRVYYAAEPKVKGGDYRVIVMPLLGMGRLEAATATKDAIRRWQPRYVVLVGIAGGVAQNGVALGDVVLADQVADYSLGKERAKTEIRWRAQQTDRQLFGRADNLPPDVWRTLIKERRPVDGEPASRRGTIATGDRVIAAKTLLKTFREDWPQLVGVEMEAGGAALACFDAPQPRPDFFMVRGVSDLANAKKDSARVKAWRAYACDVAAAFTIGLLQSGPVVFR